MTCGPSLRPIKETSKEEGDKQKGKGRKITRIKEKWISFSFVVKSAASIAILFLIWSEECSKYFLLARDNPTAKLCIRWLSKKFMRLRRGVRISKEE